MNVRNGFGILQGDIPALIKECFILKPIHTLFLLQLFTAHACMLYQELNYNLEKSLSTTSFSALAVPLRDL